MELHFCVAKEKKQTDKQKKSYAHKRKEKKNAERNKDNGAGRKKMKTK
jgi:hypothetical protein